jgi:hypothetical protein
MMSESLFSSDAAKAAAAGMNRGRSSSGGAAGGGAGGAAAQQRGRSLSDIKGADDIMGSTKTFTNWSNK